MTVSDSFIAIGGETYLTIGNFRDDPTTTSQFLGGPGSGNHGAYYYIDDVYLGGIPPPVGIKENQEENKITLFPNPSNDILNLQFDFEMHDAGEVNLYDLLGKKISSFQFMENEKNISLNLEWLNSGLYFYEIVINDKRVKQDKLTIVK